MQISNRSYSVTCSPNRCRSLSAGPKGPTEKSLSKGRGRTAKVRSPPIVSGWRSAVEGWVDCRRRPRSFRAFTKNGGPPYGRPVMALLELG